VHPLPETWPILISEALFNLRSALDHLAFELTVRHSGDPLDNEIAENCEFPLVRSASDFAKSAKRRLAGVNPALLPLFERLQPYPERLADAAKSLIDEAPEMLGQLHEMHRIEKHRFPPIAVHAVMGASWSHDQPEPVLEGYPGLPERGLLDGDIVARVRKAPGYVPLTSAQPRFSFRAGVMLNRRFHNMPGTISVMRLMVGRAYTLLTDDPIVGFTRAQLLEVHDRL
jgi:hypothetical protein